MVRGREGVVEQRMPDPSEALRDAVEMFPRE